MTATPFDLVLLRGLVRESGHWLDFPEALRAAFPGANVFGLDIVGSGRHHATPSPLSIGEIVEALRRDFLSERAASAARRGGAPAPALVLAVSLGGMVLFEWMRRYPGDFARAVIANSSLRGVSPPWRRLRPAAWPVVARALAEKDLLRRERHIVGLVSNRREVLEATARRWADVQRARPVSVESFARQLAAGARYAPPAQPPSVPTLLLAGDGDRLCHPACSRDLARRFALEIEAHPTAGHALDLDAPEWVIERLRAWFGPVLRAS